MQRKIVLLLLAVAVLFGAGCIYEAPLTDEHAVPVDTSVLGLWEYVPAADEKQDAPERMMVLRYSATEYLIHYPTGEGGMYFRGYPLRVGEVPCVQLQLIGNDEGPVDSGEKELFHVASYRVTETELEVRTLNMELVAADLPDPASLRAAFLKHRGNPELFVDPGRFRKVREPD